MATRYGLDDIELDCSFDRSAFPAQSSVLDEQALGLRILGQYDIGPVRSCRFYCRGDADIYRVSTNEARCYLKAYRPPHTAARAEAEARLVEHLAERGVPVVRAIRRQDGAFVSEVRASEGARPVLLFEEAPAALPDGLGPELLRAFGATVARAHVAADAGFEAGDLPTLDIGAVVLERLPYIGQFAAPSEMESLQSILERVQQELASVELEALDTGVCHGDLVISNARAGPRGGVTLFDFGNAATTLRGFDLAVVFWSLSRRYGDRGEALWRAFQDGYAELRPLPVDLIERLPLYLIVRELMFLGGNAATLPLRLGTEPLEGDFLQRGFARIFGLT